jgi:hypothetical protein
MKHFTTHRTQDNREVERAGVRYRSLHSITKKENMKEEGRMNEDVENTVIVVQSERQVE